MRQLYAVLGWGIVVLSVVHMSATFPIFHALTSAAIWFFSGGVVFALTGALNLLHRAYGHVAPGLRRVCVGTNVAVTILAAIAGVATHASIAGFTLVLGLFGGASALALTRPRQ